MQTYPKEYSHCKEQGSGQYMLHAVQGFVFRKVINSLFLVGERVVVENDKCINNFEITSRVLMKESTLNKKCYRASPPRAT